MKNTAPNLMPRMPKVALIGIVGIYFTPFVCLFLPSELAMDRDYSHPYLAYTTPIAFFAPFFFYLPLRITSTFRLVNGLWFYGGAFLQSLFLTLLTLWVLRMLLRSRWHQLTSRKPE
ncbi:MAG: hypothetical protein EOP86_19640 [Verrucomicrobiaceae bacterium]|nr:MAG: hypothetical protein EOP86_19640 [Verrucomicrobiaceae bacterium]